MARVVWSLVCSIGWELCSCIHPQSGRLQNVDKSGQEEGVNTTYFSRHSSWMAPVVNAVYYYLCAQYCPCPIRYMVSKCFVNSVVNFISCNYASLLWCLLLYEAQRENCFLVKLGLILGGICNSSTTVLLICNAVCYSSCGKKTKGTDILSSLCFCIFCQSAIVLIA